MTIDETILRALENGSVTVEDLLRRFDKHIRTRLEKLRVRGVVMREGKGGPYRRFTYTLLHPERAAAALKAKGGGLSVSAKQQRPAKSANAGKQRRTPSKDGGKHLPGRSKQKKR
jgi:hypothetical protein